MAPRVPDSEDDNSDQEVEDNVQVKPEPSTQKRRVPDDNEDDEEDQLVDSHNPSVDREENEEHVDERVFADVDEEDDENEVDEEVSPNGRKRRRLNEDGSSQAIQRDVKPLIPRVNLVRDKDGYVPGSILRVALSNFMTYDWTEFRPGPFLNMVLGPNGTGKSSIASAICLGLGWSPTTLNRSPELNAFVKHGATHGWIEIELKGHPNQGNLVIRRSIVEANKSSTFKINDKQVPLKEVRDRVAALNVQVGNLCAFLPQERVSEFAQMTPQQLLVETQNAAGAAGLSQWHALLIDLGGSHKGEVEKILVLIKEAEHIEQKNAVLEREVQRYNERRAIERHIELLLIQLPFARYGKFKAEYDATKRVRARLGAELQQLRKDDSPLEEKKKELEDLKKKQEGEKKEAEQDARRKYGVIKKKIDAINKEEEASEETANRIALIRKNEKERRTRIQKLTAEIARFQKMIDNPPDMSPLERIAEERRANYTLGSQIKENLARVQGQWKEIIESNAMHKAEIEKANEELARLDDQSQQRINMLRKWDRDCADSIVWLRKNQHRFQMEVIEPPIISLTVPDARYTDAVENCISGPQLKTFVCQCDEDSRMLNKLVNDTDEALGRRGRINVWWRPKNQDQLTPPPLTREALAGLGFDGYVIDYVDGPDALFWFLKKELNMHRTAVGLNASRINPKDAADAVSDRASAPVWPPPATTFIAGRVSYSVSRSHYGRQLAQQSTRDLRQARNLAHISIDPSVKVQLTEQKAMAMQAIEETEGSLATFRAEEKKYLDEQKELKDRDGKLLEEKERVNRLAREYNTAKTKQGVAKDKLAQEENAPSGEEERTKLKALLLKNARKRTQMAVEYTRLIKEMVQEYAGSTRIGLEIVQLMSNIDYLNQLNSQQNEARQKAEAEWQEIDAKYQEAKAKAKEWLDKGRAMLAAADDELSATFQNNRKDAMITEVEELENALEAEKAKLELNLATNPGVIEKYERQKAEAEKLRAKVAQLEQHNKKVAKKIQDTRDKWYPALQELVSSINEKFSDAFSRIGCVGEVKIGEHDDYKQWSIDIFVKFRDSEQLQRLTGQRQSGGERALTTIFYLMSLTELARAPFSLVDEINQGMDARYERAVHNNLVETTCRDQSGQYFLITPKLLPNLMYHERMKILCVNNGEWLAELSSKKPYGDMRKMLEHKTYYPYESARSTPAVSVH